MIPGGRNRVSRAVAMPQPWSELDDPTAEDMLCHGDCNLGDYNFCHGDCHAGGEFSVLNALHHYLPSNDSDTDIFDREADIPVDPYSCDEFRMYVFKIRRCARGRTHDWTDCPYAHPGEKARRRDPRKFMYSGTACPDYRKGSCKKGDTCEFAHGVFECWLHPDRYRTQACKDGTNCRRRVCFFAHTPEQLRVLNPHSPRHVAESPPSYDGSPLRQAMDSLYSKGVINSGLYTPPDSPPSDSPPMSPPCARGQSLSRSLCSPSVNEMVASLRNLQLNRMKSVSLPVYRPMVQLNPGFMSPRAAPSLRPAFSSLPTTPTQLRSRSGMVRPNFWDLADAEEELEPVMDRVESGKALRAQIYEKLSKANSLDRDCGNSGGGGPDLDWVSDIIK